MYTGTLHIMVPKAYNMSFLTHNPVIMASIKTADVEKSEKLHYYETLLSTPVDKRP